MMTALKKSLSGSAVAFAVKPVGKRKEKRYDKYLRSVASQRSYSPLVPTRRKRFRECGAYLKDVRKACGEYVLACHR